MHSLSCCVRHQSGVLAAYWITGTVSVHEETVERDRWKNSSDLNRLSAFHLQVHIVVDFMLTLVDVVDTYLLNHFIMLLYLSTNLCNSVYLCVHGNVHEAVFTGFL